MRLNRAAFLLFILIRTLLRAEDCINCHSPDTLQFGKLWSHIQYLESQNLLEPMILKRRVEIREIKDHWKQRIPSFENLLFLHEVENLVKDGLLKRAPSGSGGAYILSKPDGQPAFVIKPFDEDMFCLNNSKALASPYCNHIFRVRPSIPLYRSMQAEALSYSFAEVLNLIHLTPETHLGVLTHPLFFDIVDREGSDQYLLGSPVREKLCSIQRYLPNQGTLHDLVKKWIQEKYTERQIREAVSAEELENLLLLIWLFFDTDAHAGNIYVTEDLNQKIVFVKFDNGLTFPEKNEKLLNSLYFLPQMKKPPSERFVSLILDLPMDTLIEKITLFEMESCLQAFLERAQTLQILVEDPSRSLREIDLRIRSLELPNGPDAALAEISMQDLERITSYE